MPQKTYIDVILSCFASMDIAGLRLFLKSEYSYQDTTKEIFLSKLANVFQSFSKSGDTALLAYEGACRGKSCDNCGVKGYRFVGNYSKNYIDLLFVIISDDIRDIYHCGDFKSDAELDDLQINEYIYIDKDDEVTFHKTPEYWEKVFGAYNAYSELVEDPPKPFDYEFLRGWLYKHFELNTKVGNYHFFNPKMKWSPFSLLYYELKEIGVYIPANILEILHANYTLQHAKTEDELIVWVQKHEITYEKAPHLLRRPFDKEGENYRMKSQNPVLILTGKVLIETLAFLETLQKHRTELLNKYTTFAEYMDEKMINYEELEEETNDIPTLRFHLKRRIEMKKLGINFPLYINQKSNQPE